MKMIAGAILVLAAVLLRFDEVFFALYYKQIPKFSANPSILDSLSETSIALVIGCLGFFYVFWGAWEDSFRQGN